MNSPGYQSGMALFSVLCVMVILLIISIAIVSLSTGNLTTSGNIHARLQALNLASAASVYCIYELSQDNDPNLIWSPGNMPAPQTGLTFADHHYSPLTNTNGLPGTCRAAYINNLHNPNITTVAGGPSFYPSLTSTEVYGETAVIIAQGEYEGFKRTIKITVKNVYFTSAAEDTITISDGPLMLNGIESAINPVPIAGSLYAGNGINCENITSVRILNGSVLTSNGPVTNTGSTIPLRFIEQNKPGNITMPEWSMANPLLTDGSPSDPNRYTTIIYSDEPSGLPPGSITRPSFPSLDPNIPDDRRYVFDGTDLTFVNQNIFINGSLHVRCEDTYMKLVNSNVFINGTLTLDTDLIGDNSKLFVAGYDPNGLSISMEQSGSIISNTKTGVAVFAEGDIKIFEVDNISSGSDVDTWISSAPSDIKCVTDIFNMTGIVKLDASQAWDWYLNDTILYPSIFPYDICHHVFSGCHYCDHEFIDRGLKPVPEEVAQWFSMSEAQNGMKWATEQHGMAWYTNWEGFVKNPSVFPDSCTGFFQGVIFTHGTFMAEKVSGTICVTGAVFSDDNPACSPPGHGGKIHLKGGSYILYCPSYLKYRSSQIVIKPVLTTYSWHEL